MEDVVIESMTNAVYRKSLFFFFVLLELCHLCFVLRLKRGKRRPLAADEEDDDASKDDDNVVMETSISETLIPKPPPAVKFVKDKEPPMPKTGTEADEEAEVGGQWLHSHLAGDVQV